MQRTEGQIYSYNGHGTTGCKHHIGLQHGSLNFFLHNPHGNSGSSIELAILTFMLSISKVCPVCEAQLITVIDDLAKSYITKFRLTPLYWTLKKSL